MREIKLIKNTDKEYPKRLLEIENAPKELYIIGNEKLLNKVVKVLLIGESEKDKEKLYGYTETMKLVNVSCDKKEIGNIVSVNITDAKSFSLDGNIVK